MLGGKRELLSEYFSLEFNDDMRYLVSIPLVLKGYSPSWSKLPVFLGRVCREVDWTVEEVCFKDLCNEFALFYALGSWEGDEARERAKATDVIAAFKGRGFSVPRDVTGAITRLVNLPDLYKVC